MKILMKPNLNLKLVIASEYKNIKTFLLKVKLKIGKRMFLPLAKLKIQFHGHMQLVI